MFSNVKCVFEIREPSPGASRTTASVLGFQWDPPAPTRGCFRPRPGPALPRGAEQPHLLAAGGGAGLATGLHAGAGPGAGQAGAARPGRGCGSWGGPGVRAEEAGKVGEAAPLAAGSAQHGLAGRGRRASRPASAGASDPRPGPEPGRGRGEVSGSAGVWGQRPRLPPLACLARASRGVGTPCGEPRTPDQPRGPAPARPQRCPRCPP